MMAFYRASTNNEYKSAGERAVADGLHQLGLKFSYEYPWAVMVHGKPRIFYPDFTLKDYGVIIEYVGMQGHQDYDRIIARKEWIYKEASIPVILLRPDDLQNDWPKDILGMLEDICKERQGCVKQVVANLSTKIDECSDAGTRLRIVADGTERNRIRRYESSSFVQDSGSSRIP